MEKKNKTIIKKSLTIDKCPRCNCENLIHTENDEEDIDTSWEEETVEFLDGYWCEECNIIISADENHTSITLPTEKVMVNDIRSSSKEEKEKAYNGAFSK